MIVKLSFRMKVSVFDLFTIGIGPSSSHTVGPMKAAARFVNEAQRVANNGQTIAGLRCDLYGSLAATGKGHGTDDALLLGFLGELPDKVEIETVPARLEAIKNTKSLTIPSGQSIAFDPSTDLDFKRLKPLPLHPNGMHFIALDAQQQVIHEQVIYSLGGGFIATEAELKASQETAAKDEDDDERLQLPLPFRNADELLTRCQESGLSIAEVMLANESTRRSESDVRAQLAAIWEAMQQCVSNGLARQGQLPGGLKVERRARKMHQHLLARGEAVLQDPLTILDWVNLYALAVNEENAAGGRVVTAPTNGAAGIIPAVLHYATRFRHSPHPDAVNRFLLTAGAIATLYKTNASISGADVGCQGEVGVACSMAAAGLVEYLGGSPLQVENAAEIGMEHNLGLTCDPIGGLVQIPCIERNAMGAVKAINAARMAMSGDGFHFVSLDKVIKTMFITGRDMMDKYKETSRGGLAVNVVEC